MQNLIQLVGIRRGPAWYYVLTGSWTARMRDWGFVPLKPFIVGINVDEAWSGDWVLARPTDYSVSSMKVLRTIRQRQHDATIDAISDKRSQSRHTATWQNHSLARTPLIK
jgi:hypothetical protein